MQGIHIIVQGKVQGVGFRYHTQRRAASLKITGTVENKYDGSVEIFAFGEEASLNIFKKWCQKGPAYSFVKNFKVNNIPYKQKKYFEIL